MFKETELVDLDDKDIIDDTTSLIQKDSNFEIETDDEGEEFLLRKNERVSRTLLPEEKYLVESTMLEDVVASVIEAKYIAPLVSIMCLFVALYITGFNPFIRYRETPKMSHEEFKMVRPILSDEDMTNIHRRTMYADPLYDNVALKFFTTAGQDGHAQPPNYFFEGIVFGITHHNSHDLEYTSGRRKLTTALEVQMKADLERDLVAMEPRPTAIFPRSSLNFEFAWQEEGLAVYFSTEDLLRQGMFSSDVHFPFKRAQSEILKVARAHRQVYVTQWFPSKFGNQDPNQPELKSNPYRNQVIVQQVVPTRTGLNSIKSTCVVWVLSVNSTEVAKPPRMVRKEWTDEDHWSQYLFNNSRSTKSPLSPSTAAESDGSHGGQGR